MPCPPADDPGSSLQDQTPQDQVKTCLRCKTEAATAVLRDAHYCRPCALVVIDTKAKPGLELARGAGLAKLVENAASSSTESNPDVSANIGVAFSGGINSRVLLSMVRRYFRPQAADGSQSSRLLSQKQPKAGTSSQNAAGRFREVSTIYVFYVDSSSLFPQGSDGSVDRTTEIEELVSQENCPDLTLVPLKIQDIYASGSDGALTGLPWTWSETQDQSIAQHSRSVTDAKQAARDLIQAICPSDVSRTAAASARTRLEDLHRILLHSLLRRAAQQYDCSALLYGETGTRMSIRLIENLAKGAGHKLPIEISDACWIDQTLVTRPLKAHLAHEIQYFAQENALKYLKRETVLVPATVTPGQMVGETPVMDKTSISRLTETFILNLEKGVPSTVSTVGRTGSKMVLNNVETNNQGGKFDVVGPSVALPSRGAKSASGSVVAAMSGVSISDAPLAKEPRVGTRGIRLAQTSAACPRWDTTQGCVFCSMPYTQDARFWKRNITISSLTHVEPEQQRAAPLNKDTPADQSWVCLADHLCYACLLVLLPSPTSPTPSLLPPFVLDNLRTKLQTQHASQSSSDDDSDQPPTIEGTAQGAQDTQPAQQFVQHKLDPSQLKAQIDEFLI